MTRAPYETGIVLSGGGARAAYQIGALRAVARILGRSSTTPFRVIGGTSAGAVSAIAPSPRATRLGVLVLVVTLAILALEMWGIRASLNSLF